MRRFWKYTGLGNDFILFDATREALFVSGEVAQALCDRRRGIGADGVLVVAGAPSADARLTVINADGSEAEMCGNGLRCAARFLDEVKGLGGRALQFETRAGPRRCRVRWEQAGRCLVTAEMGRPILAAAEIPMRACGELPDLLPGGRFVAGGLRVGDRVLTGTALSMGNPHFVTFDLSFEAFAALAPRIERHPAFPNRTNAECARQIGPACFEAIVWERGCGFTQACGTGACAVAAAAILGGRASRDEEIEVRLPGGALAVRMDREGALALRGEAARAFEGMIDLAATCSRS